MQAVACHWQFLWEAKIMYFHQRVHVVLSVKVGKYYDKAASLILQRERGAHATFAKAPN